MNKQEEIEAIKQLKYKYLRCVDCKLWDDLAECFAEDAVTNYASGQYSFQGKDQIISFLKEALQPTLLSMHQCFHPEIELTGDNTAKGRWAFQDYLIDLNSNFSMRGYAFYLDEYKKIDGEWKIKTTGYDRVFEESWSRNDIPSAKMTENMFAPSSK